jgi:hypothetical protein
MANTEIGIFRHDAPLDKQKPGDFSEHGLTTGILKITGNNNR